MTSSDFQHSDIAPQNLSVDRLSVTSEGEPRKRRRNLWWKRRDKHRDKQQRQLKKQRQPKRLSPLTRRILAVNLVPLSVLLAGLFYLDQYEDGLLQGHMDGMRVEGRIISAAIGANAYTDPITGSVTVDTGTTRILVHRLTQTSGHQARVYGAEAGQLVADSRAMFSGGRISVQPLPPLPGTDYTGGLASWIWDKLWPRDDAPSPQAVMDAEPWEQEALIKSFQGHSLRRIRPAPGGLSELHVLEPIQHVKQVVGVLILSSNADQIRQDVAEQRLRFAMVVLAVLVMTIALSLYLAGTIGRPVVQLAAAARRVRAGYNRREQIPDFSSRDDEIGALSVALKDMTQALYQRLDAIESFAADVAHEVKTPLTSLRSAVETMDRAKTDEMRTRLLDVIKDDVDRLDRLISDISEASRVDAEMSRADTEPVNVIDLAETIVEVAGYRAHGQTPIAAVRLHAPEAAQPIWVDGVASRLGQVVRNLIDNAISFTPADRFIDLYIILNTGNTVTISVRDEGPGLPPGDVERLFDRFYSDRGHMPEASDMLHNDHSGLGLSIVRQIVDVHKGTITAQNRYDDDGQIMGARFDIELPVSSTPNVTATVGKPER